MSAGDIELVEVAPDAAPAIQAVGCYFAELAERFEGGFDPDSYGASSTDDLDGHRVVVVLRDGAPIGCVTLRPLGRGIAEIKRMWVDPGARGLGLGRRLLAEAEGLAAEQGCRTVRLDTNASLAEAIALYERHGYRRIPRYNDNPYAQLWFEKVL